MKKHLLLLVHFILFGQFAFFAQTNIVTYAGNSGKETFYDVTQITDGTFLVCGYASDLNWISSSVPRTQLSYTGSIPNSLGSNRYGIILHLSADLQNILHVVHFPQGAVEDVRFIKTNTQPYSPTGDLYISCNTEDTYNNDGGYIIAKLNNNFINATPTALSWFKIVWAMSYAKEAHPWDVSESGKVYYVSGEAHGYDWSAMYCLNQNGQRTVVENWRTHWLTNGSEWKGTPASANPNGGLSAVNYSGIAFKIWNRCELRSWTSTDFNATLPDGNGGTRKGKWPADFLFNSECDNSTPVANGPGYSGYSAEACCPVWGASSVVTDRRNGNFYLGMNFKSYYNPQNTPDFEPAVLAFDSTGNLLWWNRLYHEITPNADTVGSIPDQYIDALAIDYANNKLVVGARAHGNNTENFWEGNTITANPGAYGFQNQFTGSNGNIHQSWLGKLDLSNGTITNSTYMAELAEGTGGLGTAHADPNLDGWPDPNTGWPDVNTTRMAKNALKVSSSGDVCVLAVGRRTITTANAYQKMVKPYYGGKSAWNSFVRVYDNQFHVPKYSSLVVGVWDTLTQAGGDNIDLFGVYKTTQGVICVGRQKADISGVPVGNNLPVINVTPWGNSTPQSESAVLVYYKASVMNNSTDSISTSAFYNNKYNAGESFTLYPNPASANVHVRFENEKSESAVWTYLLTDISGRRVGHGNLINGTIDISAIAGGVYQLKLQNETRSMTKKLFISTH